MNSTVNDKKLYCLWYTHPKCQNCLNQKNWEDINELSNNDFQKAIKLSIQGEIMNSHQRRLNRRKNTFNVLKKIQSFKIPKPNEKDFTVKQIKTLIKDFNLPNKHGIVFIQDNLKELVEDLKKNVNYLL